MAETLEEIANRIANRYGYTTGLYNDILTALRNERERCAKILEKRISDLASVTHPTNQNTWEQLDLADLVTAIRKGE